LETILNGYTKLNMPEIKAKTWTRFVTTNFCVGAELMGSAHAFVFEKHNIKVRLPKLEDANRDEKYDQIARVSSSRADTKEPLSFRIYNVDLEIEIPDLVSVPEEALTKPPKQIEYFSQDQKEVVDNIIKTQSLIAERAFDYWLGIIRWSSGSALIGQPEISSVKSGWATYIKDASTNNDVWMGPLMFTSRIFKTWVEDKHWKIAADHLNLGDELPLHMRFLHDAEASVSSGHHKKSILELAMACEVYLRYSVFEFIPKDMPQELKTYIEEANINQYASKFFKSLVPENHQPQYTKLSKEISSLMSRRNSYVHMGYMKDADSKNCHRFIDAMKTLFNIQLQQNAEAVRTLGHTET
jgi:hypothetical protein